MQLKTKFGEFGGVYAPESLIPILEEIEAGFIKAIKDPQFQRDFNHLLTHYAGRITPLTHTKNLSAMVGREIYLKREDLLHGGAHKTNNTIGQMLLAKYMGKTRVIAETGAGQHGTATAMVGALLELPVTIYMGAKDVVRQASNVHRMKLFGAEVISVETGAATLKDAINDAMRDWISHPEDTYYCFGTAAGPHPFPTLVKYFHRCIGQEAREQVLSQAGQLPAAIFACIGGGSNAIGLFSGFVDDPSVKLYGAEAAGLGIDTDQHAATLEKGSSAVFHGMHSLFLQDDDGQIVEPHSVSAGLDYPGIGPEHAYLQSIGRATYLDVTDKEALDAFELLSRKEGIIPALESSHAVALAMREAKNFPEGSVLLVNLSGRGDKDLETYFKERSLRKTV